MPQPDGDQNFHFTIAADESGCRLDVLLADRLDDSSRSLLSSLIRIGHITIDGQKVKPGYRVHGGETVSGKIPAPIPIEVRPQAISLDVLYEDSHLVVIDKPAGMVVHPAPGHTEGTVVNALLHHCKDLKGIGGELRPGIVHRLDMDTSGVLVVAKTQQSLGHLASQFKARTVEKVYQALVCKVPEATEGEICLPIGRHPIARKKMCTYAPSGRWAVTHWRLRQRFDGIALLNAYPKTGRTHQIRVHLAAIGHPIVGDALYGKRTFRGEAKRRLQPVLQQVQRHMLHAHRLGFIHPQNGARMTFESHMPQDMDDVIAALERANPDPQN